MKSKPALILPLIFGLLGASGSAAQVDVLWTRNFGDDGWDFCESVQQTSDGGYILTGVTGADVYHHSDIYLVKTDDEGFTQWTQTIGRSQTEGRDYGLSIQQTRDDGYIITGFTFLASDNALLQAYLVKTDAWGDTVWTRTYGGPLNESGQSVQQTADGGYIITGYTYSYGAGDSDVFLVKTDDSGDIDWMKTFGGPSTEAGYEVQQTSDGGYVIVGSTFSFGSGDYDVYLIKTDASGDTQWMRTFGGDREDQGFSVRQTDSGGFIIAGATRSYGAGESDVYLIRTDDAGDTLWTRTCGGNGTDTGFSVWGTGRSGFITAGKSNSFGEGDDDVYLIKTDDSGNITWSWAFEGAADEIGRSVRQTGYGEYVIAGNTGSYYNGGWDFYLMNITVDPIPDMRANGLDGPVEVTDNESVRITASLDPGNMRGVNVDWWIGALTISGTYWINPSLHWVQSSTPVSFGQYPLYYFSEIPLLEAPLPVGVYMFFSVFDMNPDGIFDITWYDYVDVFSTSGGE